MLAALADPILPIFAVLLVGFAMRKAGLFDAGHAAAINRFVFFLATPALVFTVIATAPIGQLYWPALLIYFAVELLVYAVVAAIARFGFGRDIGEAMLLGMAASFSNHVFFVRPIAILVYGEDAIFPIGGHVLLDVAIFCGTVMLVEATQAAKLNVSGVIKGLLRNPFVYAPALAALTWFLGPLTPSGAMTFAQFAGGAAAPVSLFALGIVLAGLDLTRISSLVWIVVGAKLLLHPGGVALGLPLTLADGDWALMPILTAAAPCGAMPFVIATQYGLNTATIAKAVLLSTVLSVLTLSVLIS